MELTDRRRRLAGWRPPAVAVARRTLGRLGLKPGAGTHLLALDVVVAAAFTAAYAAFASMAPGDGTPVFRGPEWLGLLVAGAVGLPLVVRRRWPKAVLAVVVLASITAAVLDMTREPYLATAYALYVVALVEPARRSAAALAAALLGLAAAIVLGDVVVTPTEGWADASALVALVWVLAATGWGAGLAMRRRRARAAVALALSTQQAITEERLRIARELHDIVAHNLSLITVKASVAAYVADARPDEAKEALQVIETTSRGALTEMRHMLGVLRLDDAAQATLAPAPGVDGLSALVQRTREAGVAVELTVLGDQRLPDGVGLAVYRVVQEALTNVVKHAARGRCAVTVEVTATEARVDVVDDGGESLEPEPGRPAGHGIVGMRERVTLYGGTLSAEPRASGGFRVHAILPFQPPQEAAR